MILPDFSLQSALYVMCNASIMTLTHIIPTLLLSTDWGSRLTKQGGGTLDLKARDLTYFILCSRHAVIFLAMTEQ